MGKQTIETFKSHDRRPDFSGAIPDHAKCGDILTYSLSDIVEKFETEARKKIPAARELDSGLIIDSLPKFLKLLGEALGCGVPIEKAHEISKVCELHGKQRALIAHYTLEEVLFEYAVLRRIILSTLRKHAEVTVQESDVIHEAIQEGMIQAASEFTRIHSDARDLFEEEKQKLADELRKSQELQTRIFESSEDCYKILDLKGNLLVLTERSRNHLEIQDSSPLIGKSWIRFWSREEDVKSSREAVQKAAAGGIGHFVGYYPTPSKKRKWWDVLITPIRDKSGKPESLLAVSRDITTLQETEEALKSAQGKIDQALIETYRTFKEMTDSLPVMFWWTEEGGLGNHYNKKFYEYTGLPATFDSESRENFHPIVHPDDLPQNIKIRQEALEKKSTATFQERLRRWDGEYRWHLVHATPVFNEDGTLKRWYATSTDIHDQKISELEKANAAESLKVETAQLNTKNVELDRFAAIAAHDLKSPLNSITQFTELLAEQYRGRLDEDADQYIDFIVNAAKRMKELIDNLLEFSRAGTLDKNKLKPIDVLEVISTVRKNLLSEIQQTDARITFRTNLPKIMGNPLQITQLFQNLIANAIKFHKPHQPPIIHINFSEANACWCFSIEDQGIGMDPKYSSKIFEIFNKLHGTNRYEGSGIGLAVCKRIVEAHGGKIWFESAPEKGTTFFFTLPKGIT